jgi:hypothetical protein
MADDIFVPFWPFFFLPQVASLQGWLLKNKTRPKECVDETAAWVVSERETRAKLKKEREEVTYPNLSRVWLNAEDARYE